MMITMTALPLWHMCSTQHEYQRVTISSRIGYDVVLGCGWSSIKWGFKFFCLFLSFLKSREVKWLRFDTSSATDSRSERSGINSSSGICFFFYFYGFMFMYYLINACWMLFMDPPFLHHDTHNYWNTGRTFSQRYFVCCIDPWLFYDQYLLVFWLYKHTNLCLYKSERRTDDIEMSVPVC